MPTNLPPDAQEAERRYREAETVEEKVATLEEYISLIPKHKGTDHLRADLRRKLSKLKETAQTRKKSGKQASPFHIDREGAGQVVVAGMTNVGKSSLVVALTNAEPQVSEAPYTTWEPTPGMVDIDNVPVQLIDTPPLTPEFVDPEMLNLIRRADLLLLVIDLQTYPLQQMEDALAILEENRIVPEQYLEQDGDERRLARKPLLIVVNRLDDESLEEDFEVLCELVEGEWPLIPVSARTGRGLDRLKQAIFDRLGIMRVFAKPPGRPPDLTAPFVLALGSTVEDLAGKVHRDFLYNLKSARVWGSGVHDGQMVGRDHVLQEGDVVELRA
ncbi:MAG: TGS domain-containing protein [Chloroflexi bacterium]|nr:MAG: TGS domain-containing protein [Chloroflexota bacterium]